jgi:hypothetical protein
MYREVAEVKSQKSKTHTGVVSMISEMFCFCRLTVAIGLTAYS